MTVQGSAACQGQYKFCPRIRRRRIRRERRGVRTGLRLLRHDVPDVVDGADAEHASQALRPSQALRAQACALGGLFAVSYHVDCGVRQFGLGRGGQSQEQGCTGAKFHDTGRR